jgi:imidazolonepropionase-like amidohydrolase
MLEPGAEADLLLLAGDPLSDPQALTRPVAAIRSGRVVFDHTGLLASLA